MIYVHFYCHFVLELCSSYEIQFVIFLSLYDASFNVTRLTFSQLLFDCFWLAYFDSGVNVPCGKKVKVKLKAREHIYLAYVQCLDTMWYVDIPTFGIWIQLFFCMQAHLQEIKNNKNESVSLYIEHNGKKHHAGRLHSEIAPDQPFELDLAKTFTLSHDRKIGSVSFYGNKYDVDGKCTFAPYGYFLDGVWDCLFKCLYAKT